MITKRQEKLMQRRDRIYHKLVEGIRHLPKDKRLFDRKAMWLTDWLELQIVFRMRYAEALRLTRLLEAVTLEDLGSFPVRIRPFIRACEERWLTHLVEV